MSLRALAFFCFFLSGATGLLYEVVWTRLIGSVIGNTHFSITLVVSVFMGGLAIGSYAGGRITDRSRNPLRLYGILTLLVAITCFLVPLCLAAAKPLFAALYRLHDGDPEAPVLLAARVLVSSLTLLVPTSFMGATLPALSRYFARKYEKVGGTVGALYAINTLGAVVGAVFTGFAGIWMLGIWGCVALAVVIDLAIGVTILAVSRGEELPSVASPPRLDEQHPAASSGGTHATRLPAEARLAVAAFAAVGFVDMLLQIAWTKALVLSIGNSTYAFSLIVSLFILGIAVGGAVVSVFVDRWKNLLLALGILIAATSALVAATIPFLGYMPVIASRMFDRIDHPSYGKFLFSELALVSLVILPSTILMGTVFPIVGKIRTRAIEKVGSAIGSAYFWNTAGSILGTMAAGFLFIPIFTRVYYTLYLGAGLSLLVGALLMLRALPAGTAWRSAIAALVVAAVAVPAFLLRPYGVLGAEGSLWHPSLLSRGAYVYYAGSYYADAGRTKVHPVEEFIKGIEANNKILFYKEGVHAPVAVVRNIKGETALRISGKVEASLTPEGGYSNDMPHQILAGHLPMVLHPAPRDVLTLGLGGGVTLGTLTLYPVDSIDSLEISPEVIEAARDFFASGNRGALTNSKVRNIIGDGRNHLEYTTKTYDVITSVPSNPWIAGIGNLFTVEFFQICRDRLRDGGIICNWIHKINMRVEDFRTVVRTFNEVFGDHAQLWDLGFDALLIGGKAPIRFDADRLRKLLRNPEIAKDLGVLGITGPETFLRHFLLDARAMGLYVGRSGPLNTDRFPTLEYSCPYGLYGHQWDTYRSLADFDPAPISTGWIAGMGDSDLAKARRIRTAFHTFQKTRALWGRYEPLVDRYTALGEVPRHPELFEMALEIAGGFEAVALELQQEKPPAAVLDPWVDRRASALAPLPFGVRPGRTLSATMASYFLKIAREIPAGKRPEPQKDLRKKYVKRAAALLDTSPANLALYVALQLDLGQPQEGIAVLERLAARAPRDGNVLHMLGILEAASGKVQLAMARFSRALALTSDAAVRARIHCDAGFALQRSNRPAEAIGEYEKALKEDPGNKIAQARSQALRKKLGANR